MQSMNILRKKNQNKTKQNKNKNKKQKQNQQTNKKNDLHFIPLEPELVMSTPTYDPFGTGNNIQK